MAPKNCDEVHYINEEDPSYRNEVVPIITAENHEQKSPPLVLVWKNIILYGYLHLAALYGLYLVPWAQPATYIWTVTLYLCAALGITAGAHRLWSHKAYKARLPLRILLAVFNSIAAQNDIIEWSRDHRVHHKYSETDADPHNAKRGFFFAHCGWLLCRKHPEVKAKGKDLIMKDLYDDPVCAFQRKVYVPSVILLCFVVPAIVPWYFWGESLWNAFFISGMLRYITLLNITWCVNSASHMWGNKPYDKNINPAENLFVTLGAAGEGFHNYHHTFPYDYSTSEHGWKLNITTMFIDFMWLIGQATDRKKMSPENILRRKLRTGDFTKSFGFIGSIPPETSDLKHD